MLQWLIDGNYETKLNDWNSIYNNKDYRKQCSQLKQQLTEKLEMILPNFVKNKCFYLFTSIIMILLRKLFIRAMMSGRMQKKSYESDAEGCFLMLANLD